MGQKINELTPFLTEFIEQQKVFFVGTAAESGTVNVSPKGMDTLRVSSPNTVVWQNLTGSGNETAAHLLKNDRMTIMFCAFSGNPMILRLYGEAKCYHEEDAFYRNNIKHFDELPGTRQLIELKISLVQTSCGFAVPFMEYKEDRPTLIEWSDKKGEVGITQYQQEKNRVSLDGFETGLPEK